MMREMPVYLSPLRTGSDSTGDEVNARLLVRIEEGSGGTGTDDNS